MPQTSQIRPVRRHGREAVLGLALVAMVPAGAALAGPSLEYGPEVEARFLQRCEDEGGMGPAECRRRSERLQAALGYEAYLAQADGGPNAFARQLADRCPDAAGALRGVERGCGTGTAALADH